MAGTGQSLHFAVPKHMLGVLNQRLLIGATVLLDSECLISIDLQKEVI